MQQMCIACGGTGLEEHVDRTLPAPPCRLCRPAEAQRHMMLARDTRNVAAARRLHAYQTLRDAVDTLGPSERLASEHVAMLAR